VEHVAHMEYIIRKHKISFIKPDCKRWLWRLRHRQEDNIKMYLSEIGCGIIWFSMGSIGGFLRRCNEPFGFTKAENTK